MNERTAKQASEILQKIERMERDNKQMRGSFGMLLTHRDNALAQIKYFWRYTDEDGTRKSGESTTGFSIEIMDDILRNIIERNEQDIERLRLELRKLK